MLSVKMSKGKNVDNQTVNNHAERLTSKTRHANWPGIARSSPEIEHWTRQKITVNTEKYNYISGLACHWPGNASSKVGMSVDDVLK